MNVISLKEDKTFEVGLCIIDQFDRTSAQPNNV